MKCHNCGYEGNPEFGDFKRRFGVVHIQCPNCKSAEHITIVPWERAKMAILYPEYCTGSPDWITMHGTGHIRTRKAIALYKDGAYCIYCPVCQWGEGGGLEKEKVEELQKLFDETVKTT